MNKWVHIFVVLSLPSFSFAFYILLKIEVWSVKIQQDNTVEWKEPVATRLLVLKEKFQGIKYVCWLSGKFTRPVPLHMKMYFKGFRIW